MVLLWLDKLPRNFLQKKYPNDIRAGNLLNLNTLKSYVLFRLPQNQSGYFLLLRTLHSLVFKFRLLLRIEKTSGNSN